MSDQHLMSAFEDAEENYWTDDREQQPPQQQPQRWRGLLNFLSAPKPAPTTDAVFGNLLAKQEQPEPSSLPIDDEITPADHPPTYDEAASDTAPSYWETTIMASGWCDDVLVDELPVGSNIQLIWNLLFSFAFGIGGFLGTYLVHTTHAAKAGSVLGLALTILQSNYDSRPNNHAPWNQDPNEFRPDHPNSYEDVPTQTGTVQEGASQPNAPSDNTYTDASISWVSLIFAAFLIYYALSGYIRAYRIKCAVLAAPQGIDTLTTTSSADENEAPESSELATTEPASRGRPQQQPLHPDSPPSFERATQEV